MPHKNVWEQNGLYRVFTREIDAKEVIDSNLRIHGDPRFEDIKYVINDFERITDFEVTDYEINEIVAFDDAATLSKKSLKIALVTSSYTLKTWVNLYCEQMEESPYVCEIFSNVHDAREWVSL